MSVVASIQLTWYNKDGNEITDGVRKTEELLSDGNRFTVKSTLKFLAQSEHHNATFTCRSKSAADKVAKNAEIKIEVIGLQRIPFFSYKYRERKREKERARQSKTERKRQSICLC